MTTISHLKIPQTFKNYETNYYFCIFLAFTNSIFFM